MRSSIESVIDLYNARVKTVGGLVSQTVQVLKRVNREQEDKVIELRELLAHASSLRKKDFDALMAETWTRRRENEKEMRQTLSGFLKEQQELVAWLRKVVSNSNVSWREFELLSYNLLARQKENERRLSRTLHEVHLEQEELTIGLERLLQKGEKVRIKDLKAVIKAIQLRQEERRDEVGKMLNELLGVDEEVTTQWRKVISSSRV